MLPGHHVHDDREQGPNSCVALAGTPQSRRLPLVQSSGRNDDTTTAHTQTGEGEGDTGERGDPQCDPNEVGATAQPVAEFVR